MLNPGMDITKGKVVELFNTLHEQGENARRVRIDKSLANERQVLSDEFSYEDEWWDSEQVVHNYLPLNIAGLTGRVIRGAPIAKGMPVSSQQKDIMGSRIINDLITTRARQSDYDSNQYNVVRDALTLGCAGEKICYDPVAKSIITHPFTVFNLIMDPYASDESNARWVILEKVIDPEEAKRQLEKVGEDEVEAETDNFDRWDRFEKEGVKESELHYLPDSKCPTGLYVRMIGSTPIQIIPYPYFVENKHQGRQYYLPFCLYVAERVRNDPYGKCPTDRAVKIQQSINKLLSQIARDIKILGNVKLATTKPFADILNNESTYLYVDDVQKPEWIRPGAMPPDIWTQLNFLKNELDEIYGLMSTGQEFKTHQSPDAIAALSTLSGDKFDGLARELRRYTLRYWTIYLNQVKQFYPEGRIEYLTNSNKMESYIWKNTDLMKADVILELVSGDERYGVKQADKQVQRMQMGLEDPRKVMETSLTGQQETSAEGYKEDLVMADLQAIMQGQPISGQADPNFGLNYLNKIKAAVGGSAAMERLLQVYQQQLQQQQMAQMQMQAQTQAQAQPQPAPQPAQSPVQPGIRS